MPLDGDIRAYEAPVTNEVADTLRRALDLLGPNGECWIQGSMTNSNYTQFCAVGALYVARGKEADRVWYSARAALTEAAGYEMPYYNDTHGWPDVKAAFLRAIAKAEGR